MTFRARLVLAAAVAVAVAVVAACVAAFFTTRSSLVSSVDDSLLATAQRLPNTLSAADISGVTFQVVAPDGSTPLTNGRLPISERVRSVATRRTGAYFADISYHHTDLREYVTPVAYTGGIFENRIPAALQLASPLTGVDQQLGSLRLRLVLVALAGIVVAALLGWLVARAALVPLNGLTGSVEGLAESTDVSERLDPGGPDELGRLRRAFNRLLDALERSRESQRQLVLDASHEMRTPLTSLRTNLEVVRRLEDLPADERTQLVADVLTQLRELTGLVGDMAELARGEQRHMERTRLRLDLVVEDAVMVATTHGRARGVHFVLSSSPTSVVGQRDRLSRAVGNLLDNALKWSPDGAAVEVRCDRGTVTVRDHGPGIDPQDLPHVFDRFWRAPAARRLPGSGLGLAIVAQVAEGEGGSVAAASADGGGALFTLRLPVAAPEPGDPDGADPDADDPDGI